MSLNKDPWPGKVAEITFHEVDSQLRLKDDDSQGTNAVAPVLIGCDGSVEQTVKRLGESY